MTREHYRQLAQLLVPNSQNQLSHLKLERTATTIDRCDESDAENTRIWIRAVGGCMGWETRRRRVCSTAGQSDIDRRYAGKHTEMDEWTSCSNVDLGGITPQNIRDLSVSVWDPQVTSVHYQDTGPRSVVARTFHTLVVVSRECKGTRDWRPYSTNTDGSSNCAPWRTRE